MQIYCRTANRCTSVIPDAFTVMSRVFNVELGGVVAAGISSVAGVYTELVRATSNISNVVKESKTLYVESTAYRRCYIERS